VAAVRIFEHLQFVDNDRPRSIQILLASDHMVNTLVCNDDQGRLGISISRGFRLGRIDRGIFLKKTGFAYFPSGGGRSTATPHSPQNLVEDDSPAPQDLQVRPSAGAAAGDAGSPARSATAGAPQAPQNFSEPERGALHDEHA
jgi:hypothetical protein